MTGENAEQTAVLHEILKWIRFSGMKEVKNVLLATLDNEQKKTVYQLSDGEKTSVEISKAAGVSDWTVRNYWKIWARSGIVESIKAGRGDRYKRSFDLTDFGIDVPKLTQQSPPDEAETVTPAPRNLKEAQKIE